MLESTSTVATRIAFGPFIIDGPQGCLWRDGSIVALRRKAWEVLYRLASSRGEVISTADLLDAVWGKVAVSPQVLTNTVREVRIALGDTDDPPRLLRTVRGRGYVFVADTSAVPVPGVGRDPIVGRDAELGRLDELLAASRAGSSRVCFVSGEPGIGKTTLVEAFAARVGSASGVANRCVARGVCAEQHGAGEAYLPIFEAVEQLLDRSGWRNALSELRRCAPAWLAQLPWRLHDADRDPLERSVAAATMPRMLQQGIAFLRAAATHLALILVVEDLHWSDSATLDLLASVARRPIAAPLLVVATYRPVDAADRGHAIGPLAQELVRRDLATEIALGPLDRNAAGAYVAARFDSAELAFALADRLVDQSAGNPLFMRTLLDELVARAAITRGPSGWELAGGAPVTLDALPETLRAFVGGELDGLARPVRDVVEAASVAGLTFTAPEIARVVDRPAEEVESICEELARRGRLLSAGADRDLDEAAGTWSYAFVHAAYRRFVFEQIAPLARRRLDCAVATALAEVHAHHQDGIAGRVALHYARGGDPARAAASFNRAASHAERRCAYREGVAHLRAALAQAAIGSADVPLDQVGGMQLRLAGLLCFVESYGATAVGNALSAAQGAFQESGSLPGRFMAELGLGRYEMVAGRHDVALRHAESILAMSEGPLQPLRAVACCWAGFTTAIRGELVRATALFEEGLAAAEAPGLLRDMDAHRLMRSQLAIVVAVRGDIAAGQTHGEAALARARDTARPGDLTQAMLLDTERTIFLRDHDRGHERADETMRMAREAGLPSYLALARFYEAFFGIGAPATRLAAMRDAVDERVRLGDHWHESMLRTLVAEAELQTGDVENARTSIETAAAYVARSGERHYLAEILRVHGEIDLAAGGSDGAARRYLAAALEMARAHDARLFELRAAASLARHFREVETTTELTKQLARFPTDAAAWDLDAARAVLGSG